MSHPVETRGLRKAYRAGQKNQLVALDGLDLVVREGDIFGFIGPNGAGKTTTIKILVGLGWPTAGEASIFGHPAGSVAARRELGFLPEIASYHDFMTVMELLDIHATLAMVPRENRRDRCVTALEMVDLAGRANSRIRELSKGMQQRFGIAQALVSRPRLLILDEPTSGLDPLAQKEIKNVILELKKQGMTIFFSSHKLTEVEHICDQIGIIHRGRLLRCSELDSFLESGDKIEIRFRAGSDTASTLQEMGFESRSDNGLMATAATRDRIDAVLEGVRKSGGALYSVQPERRTLEDAFFELIRTVET